MIGMLGSESPMPSSGCVPARQVDNKHLHLELLVIHGHCCHRTQRDRPCPVGQSSQDARSPKEPPTLCPVPVPSRTSPLRALAPHSMEGMSGTHLWGKPHSTGTSSKGCSYFAWPQMTLFPILPGFMRESASPPRQFSSSILPSHWEQEGGHNLRNK